MKEYKIGIQVSSLGDRCGIATYANRVCDSLNKMKIDNKGEEVNVNAYQFVKKPQKNTDLINIQYEPGLMPYPFLQNLLNKYIQPVVITVHHIGYLPQIFGAADGFHFHHKNQYEDLKNQPWDKEVIPHPSLVYPEKGLDAMKDKWGLPKDKRVLGTFGFITGTGKNLPTTVTEILSNMNSDEFLYLGTPFWKGGDLGRKEHILEAVKASGKENQFKLDTDFVSAKDLNEKMQACDVLWAWCMVPKDGKGSQSGAVADMYGARRKLVVKDSAHYSFIGEQDKVVVGPEDPKAFAKKVIEVSREFDLKDVHDPEWLSWDNQIGNYLEYFQKVLGE